MMNRSKRLRGIIILYVMFCFFLVNSAVSFAQLPEPELVPAGISKNISRKLDLRRSALEESRRLLEREIEQHNVECSQVREDDTALVEKCRQKMAHLQSEVNKFLANVSKFDQDVKRAVAKADDIVKDEVLKEQEEFDKKNDAWLRRQQKQIRKAVKKDKKWTNEVLASIKAIRVPSPIYQPKDLDDLQPGNIILIAPEADEPISNIVSRLDQVYTGRVFKTGEKKSPASHALTVVKTVNGNLLFLDHTSKKGSRIFGEKQFLREYGHRGMYVARPQTIINGRKLWDAAKEAAKKTREGKGHGLDWTDYGIGSVNNDVVCSDKAVLAIVKASGRRLVLNPGNEQAPLQERKGPPINIGIIPSIINYIVDFTPIDITPGDFFDKENIGKYFIVNKLQRSF